MTRADLQYRDKQTIAAIQKLRFFPHSIVSGKGCYLVEENGRQLLDLSASWGAAGLGYGHPAVVEAVTRAIEHQAGASILSAVNQPAIELAEYMLKLTPGPENRRVWLGHSGSGANEAALRSLMAASGRTRIVSFVGAYHGGTAGSMSISGHSSQQGVSKLPGALFLPYPNAYRPFMGDDTGQTVLDLLDYHLQTDCPPEDVAAVFMEPIMSDGGLIVPCPGILKSIQDRLQPHGALIVCDEVKVGLGRSGKLHCFEHEKLSPDMITFGKALGGGLPLSAVVGPESVLDIAQAFAMETTCGNPVSASAGLAVLKTIEAENLAERAARIGRDLSAGLNRLAAQHPLVGDVRGRGLAMGVELVNDRNSRKPAAEQTAKVVFRAWELGLVLYYVGMHSNVLEITPPLIIKDSEVQDAVQILEMALDDVEHHRVSDDVLHNFQGW